MNDQQFDQEFRRHLLHLEEPFDAGSWALLQQRLDATFGDEDPEPVADIDKAVYHTLHRMDAPYQPAHWDLLEKRLGTVRGRRRTLWWKALEAALILLLIGNIADWTVRLGSPNVPWSPGGQRADQPVAAAKTEDLQVQTNTFSARDSEPVRLRLSAAASADFSVDRANGFPVAILPSYTGGVMTETTAPAFSPGPILAALPGVSFEADAGSRSSQPPRATIKPVRGKSHFYTFVMVAAEQNSLRQSGYRSPVESGYSAGIGAGYRKGKWGVEAGLVYASRRLTPKREVVIFDGNLQTGYYGTSLRTVETDVVAVPVRATRALAKVGRGSLHAVAGMSANIAWQKAYRYETVYFPGSAPSGQPGIQPGQQAEQRPPGRGVLEGGRLKGNAYLAAEAGLRWEHPLGRQAALFVEPSYRLAAGNTGLTPKSSRLNGFAVSAGVLASL